LHLDDPDQEPLVGAGHAVVAVTGHSIMLP
jgi:hypothetical protein